MESIYKLFCVLALVALTACNTVKMVPFSPDKEVVSIALNPDVSLPEKLTYYDLRKSVAVVFSTLVAIAVDRSNQGTMSDLNALSEDNNIDVAQIVQNAFTNQWQAQNKLPLKSGASHVLSLEVLDYGLSVPELSTRALVPTLNVRATLLDENDKVRWRAEQRLSVNDNPIARQCLDDYFTQPELLRATWQEAAAIVATGLVSQF